MPGRHGMSKDVPGPRWRRLRGSLEARSVAVAGVAVVGLAAWSLAGSPAAPGWLDDTPRSAVSDQVSRSAERPAPSPVDPPEPTPTPRPSPTVPAPSPTLTTAPTPPVRVTADPNRKPPATAALPADSGTGRRVVFDITAQQVWLVANDGTVARTYKVSGSRHDQLPVGTYEVFSKSRDAISWHGTETMEYMVRFHRGRNSNIGFHDIPVDTATGREVQTLSQLGTPLSDGCIRQDVTDAVALWEFAPVGTQVVVVRT